MPEEPHTTLKFAKVVPVALPPTISYPSEARERTGERSNSPSVVPSLPDDERPTQRGLQVVSISPGVATSVDRALLTILVGLDAGQVFTLERTETVIGRGRGADLGIDDVGISRRHARIVRTQRGCHVLEDLGSANGLFVNGRKINRVELANGDRIQIGPSLVLRFSLIAADEEALAHKLYKGSTHDALTGIYNRKHASERLTAEVAYAHRHGTLLSLVLFDLDHFKRVNDSFGHLAGDAVLRVVAAQVRRTIRTEDVFARFGGEEFVILARGIEPRSVGVLAERVRQCVERLSIPWESRTLKVTVSIGLASLSECGPNATAETLVALADKHLYEAKVGGRNRVC